MWQHSTKHRKVSLSLCMFGIAIWDKKLFAYRCQTLDVVPEEYSGLLHFFLLLYLRFVNVHLVPGWHLLWRRWWRSKQHSNRLIRINEELSISCRSAKRKSLDEAYNDCFCWRFYWLTDHRCFCNPFIEDGKKTFFIRYGMASSSSQLQCLPSKFPDNIVFFCSFWHVFAREDHFLCIANRWH